MPQSTEENIMKRIDAGHVTRPDPMPRVPVSWRGCTAHDLELSIVLSSSETSISLALRSSYIPLF